MKNLWKKIYGGLVVFFTFNLATFGMGRKSHYFAHE